MIVFVAVTHIQHGAIVDGEHKNITFDVGDTVTGLDSKSMKALWNAGALRKETRNTKESDD